MMRHKFSIELEMNLFTTILLTPNSPKMAFERNSKRKRERGGIGVCRQ